MNRQTYATYRFTIRDDVAFAHVGPPSDAARAPNSHCVFNNKERKTVAYPTDVTSCHPCQHP
jgi:hypothetical protein